MYEDEQHDCSKAGWCYYRKPNRGGKYVRKDRSKAYTYLSSEMVWFKHEGCGVRSEGIDGQARQTVGPVYAESTLSTRFSLEQTRDGKPYSVAEAAGSHTRPRIHCSIGQGCLLLRPILSMPLCSSLVSLRMIAQQSQSRALLGN